MRARLSALLGGAALVLLTAYPVAAATGYATFTPQAAAPGTAIQVALDSTNCDAAGAATLRLQLTRDGSTTGKRTTMRLDAATGQYRFTVPKLSAGHYWPSVECDPGNWIGVSANGGDGAPGHPWFTVLAAAPDTSTTTQPAPSRPPSDMGAHGRRRRCGRARDGAPAAARPLAPLRHRAKTLRTCTRSESRPLGAGILRRWTSPSSAGSSSA